MTLWAVGPGGGGEGGPGGGVGLYGRSTLGYCITRGARNTVQPRYGSSDLWIQAWVPGQFFFFIFIIIIFYLLAAWAVLVPPGPPFPRVVQADPIRLRPDPGADIHVLCVIPAEVVIV